jgi:hypothetical protein
MTAPKQPPPGVETTPGGPVVFLKEAAARLGKDPRTVMRAISAGQIRGGALPRPERLRWYVYEDQLPTAPTATSPDPRAEDLRAQLISMTEANRLLIAAQQNLLDAGEAADRYRAAAQNYLDALAQFMTPGHLGELTDSV